MAKPTLAWYMTISKLPKPKVMFDHRSRVFYEMVRSIERAPGQKHVEPVFQWVVIGPLRPTFLGQANKAARVTKMRGAGEWPGKIDSCLVEPYCWQVSAPSSPSARALSVCG